MDSSRFIRGLLDDPGDRPVRPTYNYGVLPLSDTLNGVEFNPYAGLLGAVTRPLKYFGETVSGRREFDPTSYEAVSNASDLAGAVTLGAAGGGAPAEALRAGASRPVVSKADKLASARAKVPSGLLALGDAARANYPTLRGRTAYGADADLVFNGKQPHEFSPEDWGAFGRKYGVAMGPRSNAEFEASLVPYRTQSGREFTVPGGVEDSTRPMTYYDLLHLKAQGIDPNDLDPVLHKQLHNRMVGSMSLGANAPDEAIYNRWLMGLLSPNNPLTPNEFAVAATMAKTRKANPKSNMSDIDRMASETPWSLDDMPPSSAQRPVRDEMSKEISSKYGLQAASRGGLGASGSVDYTRISDFAKMFKENPDFFRFQGNKEGSTDAAENWLNFVSRISSQVPGLSAKTGSFGGVWQDPYNAAISAIDRHMATQLSDSLFENPKEKLNFEKNVIKQFNAGKPRKEQIKSYADVIDAPGGRGVFVDQVMQHVNKHGSAKYRNAKGEINPNVPESMQGINWVREPQEVTKVSQPYLRALQANQALADAEGQGLFNSQWMHWDRIRQRVEPHEIMYPGLENIPRMSQAQHRAALKAHNNAGYLTSPNAVRPVSNPSSLAYFSNAAPMPFGLLSDQNGKATTEDGVPVF